MTTSYTSPILKDISFGKFVMRCARAMPACISMRDVPLESEIPRKFKPSNFHANRLKELENRLVVLKNMSLAELNQSAREEYEGDLECNKKKIQKAKYLRNKYIKMLRKVKYWKPPTKDHVELKDFMVNQIRSSISLDCDIKQIDRVSKLLSGEVWLSREIRKTSEDIEYHKKRQIVENERVETGNIWLKELRKSLLLEPNNSHS